MIFVHEFWPMISSSQYGKQFISDEKKDKMINQINFNIDTVKK